MPVQIGQSRDHGFDQPLGLMSDCHRRIEMFLGVLQRIVRENPGESLSGQERRAMESALQYFRSAAPLHTRDEEDSLFPRLRQAADKRVAELLARVDALEADHAMVKGHHDRVESLGRRWLQQDALTPHEVDELQGLLAALQAAYAEHIHVEDHVVFPVAAEVLSPSQLEALGQEMAWRRGLDVNTNKMTGLSPSNKGDQHMSRIDTTQTVGALVTEHPPRSRVFEQYGIDYCCGGKIPLEQACRNAGLDAGQVVAELERLSSATDAEAGRDWAAASMTELADHIEQTHHEYLRRELPRLTGMVAKIREVHGGNHPELIDVERTFNGLRDELMSHMMKEEQVLFPMIRQMESSDAVPSFHCGSVNNPIRVMEHEHDNAGAALGRLRELTRGYAAPEDGCNTYRATFSGLQELEYDLHQHIHKENNILFPRAAAREQQLCNA